MLQNFVLITNQHETRYLVRLIMQWKFTKCIEVCPRYILPRNILSVRCPILGRNLSAEHFNGEHFIQEHFIQEHFVSGTSYLGEIYPLNILSGAFCFRNILSRKILSVGHLNISSRKFCQWDILYGRNLSTENFIGEHFVCEIFYPETFVLW